MKLIVNDGIVSAKRSTPVDISEQLREWSREYDPVDCSSFKEKKNNLLNLIDLILTSGLKIH